ncbi:MAG TPA: LPS export ABC transporter periplasmic protein LptC [Candidatus Binatia bacterium]|jgi:LPS export ABC transporter protein LptC
MNRRKMRMILLIAISAILGGVTFKVGESIWQGKKKSIREKAVKTALQYMPDAALQIKDFHRAQVDGERKVWEVFGEEARYLKAEGQLVLKKPRIFFYQKDDSTVEATGENGTLWIEEGQGDMQKAQLLGEVEVNFRGYVLKTGEILYFKNTNQMLLPGRVSVRGAGMELDGSHMEVSLDDEKMRLNRDVKTKVEPDKLQKLKGKPNEKKPG